MIVEGLRSAIPVLTPYLSDLLVFSPALGLPVFPVADEPWVQNGMIHKELEDHGDLNLKAATQAQSLG